MSGQSRKQWHLPKKSKKKIPGFKKSCNSTWSYDVYSKDVHHSPKPCPIQINVIYTPSVTIKIFCRCFTETESLTSELEWQTKTPIQQEEIMSRTRLISEDIFCFLEKWCDGHFITFFTLREYFQYFFYIYHMSSIYVEHNFIAYSFN